MSELSEGTLLAGRYVLVRRIGSGGMGQIWVADDRRSKSRVALKFVTDSSSISTLELLRKEWHIGSRLMHANIIRVFEFHDEPATGFYAMQYISGPDLSVVTGAAVDAVLRPIVLIADALRYAHAKDIIHRDIKASNILLDTRGIPYLVDFGVADIAGQTATGGGTLIAASPQQRAGDPAVSADDIYALGVLITELVTGAPPVATGSDDVMSLVDCKGGPLPKALLELIADMLNENPVARPDAESVKDRLSQAGFPAGAAPPRLLGNKLVETEESSVEVIQPSTHKLHAKTSTTPVPRKDSGMSPKILYGGLAALLALFLAVIFLLPSAVEDTARQEPLAEPAVSGGPGEKSTSDAATTTDTTGNKDTIESSSELVTETGQRPDNSSEEFAGADADSALTKAATDEALGELLSLLERLQFRAIDRWGGQPYLDMLAVYAEGDKAYLNRNYKLAGEGYRHAIVLIDPFFDQADMEFYKALAAAKDAFENGDHINAVRSYDLAVAIKPDNFEAADGFARAKNLKSVLDLVEQALKFEKDLELDAARIAFEQALDLDPVWEPAANGLLRINAAIKQFSFEQRMTEGFDSLAAGDFGSARAAFEAAKALNPSSRQPTDGLLQVDQEIRLASIGRLERQARTLEKNEEWEMAIGAYEKVLVIDGDLQFAQDGLQRARQSAKLHDTLKSYIDDPDSLSKPATMQQATNTLLELSRVSPMGPRLADQKNALSRLLKRAATELDVMLISDSQTDVAIFRIAKLGSFASRQLSLRPGVYVAVGSRPGYRDVRIEFRVAPEIEMKPVVVQCEEQI